jgi:hypothetical protein
MLSTIREKKALDDALKGQMSAAIGEFKRTFVEGLKTK